MNPITKTYHLLILGLIFLNANTLLAQSENEDVQAIRQVLSEQQTAWNQGDLEAFMQGYWRSDSLKFIGSRGITYGWQSTLDNYQESYPDRSAMGELTFKIIEVKILAEDAAFVIGQWALKRKKDRPKGHFTLLWRKIDEEWVIVADHSS